MDKTPRELKPIVYPFATRDPSNPEEDLPEDKRIDNNFFQLFENNSAGSLNNVSGSGDNNGDDTESLRKTKSEADCSNLVTDIGQVTIDQHDTSGSIEEIADEFSCQDPSDQEEQAASNSDESSEDNVPPEFLESLKLTRNTPHNTPQNTPHNTSPCKRKQSSNKHESSASSELTDYDELQMLDLLVEHSEAMAARHDSPKRVRKMNTDENDPSSSVSQLQIDGFESNEPVNYVQTPSAIAGGSSVGEAGDQSSELNDSDIKNNRYSNASTVEIDQVDDK